MFLNRTSVTAPLAMRASVEHVHALSEHVLIVSVNTLTVPRVPPSERISVDDLGYTDDGITHIEARFGYMETPDVPSALALVDPRSASSRSTSTAPRTSSPPSSSGAGPDASFPGGRSASSSRRRTSPPTPPTTSGCHATGP